MKKGIVVFFLLLLVVFIDKVFGFFVFKPNTPLWGIKNYIQNNTSIPLYLPQPYLNYINHPDRVLENGKHQINNWGFRHLNQISIPKPSNTLRILFLGGSTTFGEVPEFNETFSAILQEQLNDTLLSINRTFSHVECINAGLGAATSAELLTQYLFKCKYLNPDVVVLHTGINDALTTAALPNYVYQPDYHTAKTIMQSLYPIQRWMKVVSHSNILSYIMIHLLYGKQLQSSFTKNDFFEYHNSYLWLENGNELKFSKAANAFYNNVSELVNAVLAKQKRMLLVTEVIDSAKMPTQLAEMMLEGIAKNKDFLIEIGKENNVPVCELKKEDFNGSLFWDNDGIHVNQEGEKLKALKIKPFLIDAITQLH